MLRVFVLNAEVSYTVFVRRAIEVDSRGRLVVVGVSTSATDAVEVITAAVPDVVVIDQALPPAGGLDVIAALRRASSRVKLLMTSRAASHVDCVGALAAGADGVVLRPSSAPALLDAIRVIADGGVVMPREVLDRLLCAAVSPSIRQGDELGDRDRLLWTMVAQGTGISGMARRLFVSERTAKRLVSDLRDRLGVATRSQMAYLAGREALLETGRMHRPAEGDSHF